MDISQAERIVAVGRGIKRRKPEGRGTARARARRRSRRLAADRDADGFRWTVRLEAPADGGSQVVYRAGISGAFSTWLA